LQDWPQSTMSIKSSNLRQRLLVNLLQVVAVIFATSSAQASPAKQPLSAKQPVQKTTEKAWLITQSTGARAMRYFTLCQSGACIEASNAFLVSRAPTWKTVWYNTKNRREFTYPLPKHAIESNAQKKCPYKKYQAGMWHGLRMWQVTIPVKEDTINDSALTIIAPPSDTGVRVVKYEIYFTDSLKLSPGTEYAARLFFSEVTPYEVPGLMLALRRYQSDGTAPWIFKSIDLKEIQIDPVKDFAYPVGMQKCDTLDAIVMNDKQTQKLMETFEDLGVGKPFGAK